MILYYCFVLGGKGIKHLERFQQFQQTTFVFIALAQFPSGHIGIGIAFFQLLHATEDRNQEVEPLISHMSPCLILFAILALVFVFQNT